MPRKAIDSRIPALIRNGIQEKKRSFVVVVGDRAKDVIVHLHYIMSSFDVKQNKSVLWAYKKDLLGFTSHRKKREAKIKKEVKRGIRDPNTEDPFELFVTLNDIRYVYYKETDKILGQTYGMCILQDFEAITPNLLARTVETVEGGGLVLLLLKGMKSLKQLYTMSMDVHSRYRTEAHDDVVARFNERFILSLGSCESCLVVDDELNVLPISGGKNVEALAPAAADHENASPERRELKEIKESLADDKPVGSLITLTKTVDQAKALLTFVDAISEKTLRSTVALTAARGRGKSAALGVAVAAAIAHGYSNIFVTSPSPENLKTFFEFLVKGFDALDYADHHDYTLLQSTNPDYNKAIVRINVHRQHRQTIQYIHPQDSHVLGQAELVVIDEAAAIPLPLVRKLLGPYLVFMASTINGYEGTGRSLSLKLISQLREQSRGGSKSASDGTQAAGRDGDRQSKDGESAHAGGRSLKEITLSEPIRYARGDGVEKWLNRLLCLDATLPSSRTKIHGTPHPSTCELVHVNRDTLFSFHPVSEKFLYQMMALYVASHYKNSPNDLQLMSDAPAHQLFVLIPPIKEDASTLPEPFCVVQVALEGRISRKTIMNSLTRGQRAGGDLIPWLVSQQFQDSEFASLSGSRIVRIATNPEYLNMGYGSRALELLTDFYEGKFTSLTEPDATIGKSEHMTRVSDAELEDTSLLNDDIHIRNINSMPPLFSKLSERTPDQLDYLGVSYGLTQPLHKFWKRASFSPVYLRQTANELTGEHSCVMLRPIATSMSTDSSWLAGYSLDFHKRFLSLLSYQFRSFSPIQSLSIAESASRLRVESDSAPLTKSDLDSTFSPFDLARLESYANNMLDYHVVLDLIPSVAQLYFSNRLKAPPCSVSLSGIQQSILLAIGLQRKDLSDIEKELSLPSNQLLAMLVKVVRKISTGFRALQEQAVNEKLPSKNREVLRTEPAVAPRVQLKHDQMAVDSLDAVEDSLDSALKESQRALIDALPLEKYELKEASAAPLKNGAINHQEPDTAWKKAERQATAPSRASLDDDDEGAQVPQDVEELAKDELASDFIAFDLPLNQSLKRKSKKRKAAEADLEGDGKQTVADKGATEQESNAERKEETRKKKTEKKEKAADEGKVENEAKNGKRRGKKVDNEDNTPLHFFEDTTKQETKINNPSWMASESQPGSVLKRAAKRAKKAPPDPKRPWEVKLNRKLKPFEINKFTKMKLEAVQRGEVTMEEVGLKPKGEKRGDKYKREKEKRMAKREARRASGEDVPERMNKKQKKKARKATELGSAAES